MRSDPGPTAFQPFAGSIPPALPLAVLAGDEPRVPGRAAAPTVAAAGVPRAPEPAPVRRTAVPPPGSAPPVQATSAAVARPPVQAAVEGDPGDDSPAISAGFPGPAPARSDQELDALAHELYDRLRSRLRMELLVDRERAGLVTDLR